MHFGESKKKPSFQAAMPNASSIKSLTSQIDCMVVEKQERAIWKKKKSLKIKWKGRRTDSFLVLEIDWLKES